MTERVASAPGKLLIAGEYAVLAGGPALAVAAGCRAVARLNTAAGRNQLHVANNDTTFGFELSGDALRWHHDPDVQGSLLAAAVKIFGSQLRELEPFSLHLCTREFYAGTTKQGLGSSAALAVALSGCLQQALGQPADVQTALAVHRHFQGGSGSGIDVQTSYHGGFVASTDGAVRSCRWPAGVQLVPVWTGVAASTPAMLQQLAQFAAAQPPIYDRQQARLAERSAVVLQACDADDSEALLAALAEVAAGLREFAAATGLEIWSPEHLQLAELAAQAGVVYKPSGAGGGDFGVAVSADEARLSRFRQAVTSAGFVEGNFTVGVPGLTIV